jgi:adenosine deaminase
VRRPTTPPAAALRAELAAWPKAELHLHLDGSLLVDTALDLALSRGVDAPKTRGGMRRALIAPAHGASQAKLLEAFALPIRLLQDAAALERVTRELVAVKASDGVRYVEIRWGPLLHLDGGLTPAGVIAAVCDGARDGAAAAKAAGHPIVVRLIATALRSDEPAANAALARIASRFLDRGLVGWDLAGPEERYDDPGLHGRSFEVARAGGLRLTCHAGEWGGAAQVWRALELGVERIAHGSVAIDDSALCAELRARRIALDLCPTSNVQAGIVSSIAEHPLTRLDRAKVPVTLSTDDLTVSDVSLTEEYARVVEGLGVGLDELWAIDRRSLDLAFADEATLAPLRTEFDAWSAAKPELRVGGHRKRASRPKTL